MRLNPVLSWLLVCDVGQIRKLPNPRIRELPNPRIRESADNQIRKSPTPQKVMNSICPSNRILYFEYYIIFRILYFESDIMVPSSSIFFCLVSLYYTFGCRERESIPCLSLPLPQRRGGGWDSNTMLTKVASVFLKTKNIFLISKHTFFKKNVGFLSTLMLIVFKSSWRCRQFDFYLLIQNASIAHTQHGG